MQDKLQILFEQINFPKEEQKYFKNARLTRIIGNHNHDIYHFVIEMESVLPPRIFGLFRKAISDGFPRFRKILLTISTSGKIEDALGDYYTYFIGEYASLNPSLTLFLNHKIKIDENIVTLEVSNLAEKMKFQSIGDQFTRDLKSAGFGECGLSIVINPEISTEIHQEIIEDLKEAVKDVPVSSQVEPVAEVVQSPSKKTFQRKSRIPKEQDDTVILGRKIKDTPMTMDSILGPQNNVTLEAYVFDFEVRETKTGLKIVTLKLTDYTDSIYGKMFINDDEELSIVSKNLKKGSWALLRGTIKDDNYSKELVFNIYDVNKLEKVMEEVMDEEEEKRVELHAHTMMSQMDGVVNEVDLVKQAMKWGHKAIAITDHNGCQAFPHVYNTVTGYNKGKEDKDKFKALYGAELTLIDDTVNIVVRPTDDVLLDQTYVVFDLETTGFNAGGKDSIIEIGAVKILNGEIIDRYDELINPGRKLPQKIVELTSITDDMLADKDNEETVVKRFIEWFGDHPMVAHNAKFDVSFLEMAYEKYHLGTFKNTVIDTLELSRTMDNTYARHGLSALVKRYNVPWDENAHHRGDYDAEGTALVFHKMMNKLNDRNFERISDLDRLVSKDEIHKYGRSFHVNLIAKNKVGLKNLFKIISLANTKYLYKTPRILRSEIEAHREGLLVGSGCYESEVFIQARSKSDEELTNIIRFYDYVEVQPVDCYDHLLQMNDFGSKGELIEHLKKIIRVGEDAGKLVVATGDVHHLTKEDKVYREIIVNQKVPGGGRHPLARNSIKEIPSMHFRTTKEMLDAFDFLDEETKRRIVIENTNKIADMVEIIEVIIETGGVPFSPKIDKSVETVTELVYNKAKEWYGDPLPYNIEERIAKELYGDGIFSAIKDELDREGTFEKEEYEKESFKRLHETLLLGFDHVKKVIHDNLITKSEKDLTEDEIQNLMKKELGGIIGGGFDVIYLIAQKLVKHSNDDGYLVGSRGSVGSSFVATMMGITEVNPLSAHYRCPKCQHSIFEMDGKPLGATYSSGFDLPDLACPKCGTNMIKDGNDMPFATFLGFNADKVPDIDLNFSDLNQADAHAYTKVLFGEDNVYRAGTIGTVATKTAFGYVKGWCEEKGIIKRTAEVERLALGCTGVKRTTGQHPGGIVVIPGYMDVFDFTPFQFPADDTTAEWRTTHFDYHAIDQDVLKLDILGHSDPTQLRMIQDLSGRDVTEVPLDDKPTMGIFLSPEPLGVTKEQIMCETGSLGIPEFGTNFTIGMLVDTKPTTFAELIKISGLSHGTDVWLGNAQELIRNNIVPFKDVIGCRDDIMVYLMYHGLEPIRAFKIMEFVRKGRASKDPETWKGMEKEMRDAGIEEWFIGSCAKIKYMFPKAHATAYVTSAFRIAYFKVHHPVWFYASWLTSKATDVDVESMMKGYDTIKNRIIEIINKGFEASNKELGTLESLKVCLEATARGMKFAPISLDESNATVWKVKDDTTIIPPFSSIDGLGETVAKNIVAERDKVPFLSIEDVQKRGKVSQTLIDKMRMMGIFDGMDESSQLSLF